MKFFMERFVYTKVYDRSFYFGVLFGSLLVLFYLKTAIIRSLPSKCSSKEDNFLFCWNKSYKYEKMKDQQNLQTEIFKPKNIFYLWLN